LRELKLRVEPARIVGRRRCPYAVGPEHADDQLRLDEGGHPSDDCGQSGHGPSMAAGTAGVEVSGT
jgi:hypothetical protein